MLSQRFRVEDIAFGGRGVGRLEDGRAAFVPFVITGEVVQAEIVRERRNYVETRLLSIKEASPWRVSPPCPYFGRCGGCSYQHMDAGEQLRVKARQVEQALRRIGKWETAAVEPTVPSPAAYAYRNRITVHFEDGKVGFFAPGGREVVDIEGCLLAEPEVNAALTRLRGQPHPPDGHRTLRTHATGRTFQQTNDGAAGELLRLVAELAGGGGKYLVDAYCGAGFFSKHLRSRFEEVVGIEWDRWAVVEAEREAAPHERYVCGDVAQQLAAVLAGRPAESTLLICDPPAEGLGVEVRRVLATHPPGAIIYVSCDPTTLARDIAALAGIYEPVVARPLDMFPQTAQIEVVAQLRRCK